MLKKSLLLNLVIVSAIGFSQNKKNETQIPTSFTDSKNLNKAVKNIIQPLKDQLIVGLGEGTHGTKEFNEIRSEISKMLIDKEGFKIVAFESAYGDAYFLNEAINSEIDLNVALKKNMTSIWQTKEIENLLVWIRKYNKNHKEKVIITGFDVNFLTNSTEILKTAAIQKKDYADLLNELHKKTIFQDEMWEKQNDPSFKLDMKAVVKNGTEGYLLTKKIDSLYGKNIGQNSKLALYNLELGFSTLYEASKKNYDVSRDLIMAEMINKIQSEYDKKMILFAHNGHIALRPTLVDGMGGHIKKKYGKGYYAMGTFTGFGTFGATTDPRDTKDNRYKSYALPSILENSWEEKLNANKYDNYFIDLRDNNNTLFNTNLKMRFIGYGPITPENEKFTITESLPLNECFDGIIFLKNTKASEHISDK